MTKHEFFYDHDCISSALWSADMKFASKPQSLHSCQGYMYIRMYVYYVCTYVHVCIYSSVREREMEGAVYVLLIKVQHVYTYMSQNWCIEFQHFLY